MTPPGIIVVSTLLGTCRTSSSWVLTNSFRVPKTRYSPSFAINSQNDIFNADESDCPDEEECEIDWGAMPGFEEEEETKKDESNINAQSDIFNSDDPDCPDEDECEIDWSSMPGFEEEEEESTKEKETTNVYEDLHLIGDETDDLEPQNAYVRQVQPSIEKSRTILEMNWQIENCVVDEDTCTDFCAECAGSGKAWCKFCRGTGMIAFGNDFRSCLLCVNGRVDCDACSGTGKISPWAKTHDGNL